MPGATTLAQVDESYCEARQFFEFKLVTSHTSLLRVTECGCLSAECFFAFALLSRQLHNCHLTIHKFSEKVCAQKKIQVKASLRWVLSFVLVSGSRKKSGSAQHLVHSKFGSSTP